MGWCMLVSRRSFGGERASLVTLLFLLVVGLVVFTQGLEVNLAVAGLLLASYAAVGRLANLINLAKPLAFLLFAYMVSSLAAQVIVGDVSPAVLLLGFLRLANLVLAGFLFYWFHDPLAVARGLSRLSARMALYYLASLRLAAISVCALEEIWGVVKTNHSLRGAGLKGMVGNLFTVIRALSHSMVDQALLVAEAQYLRSHQLALWGKSGEDDDESARHSR